MELRRKFVTFIVASLILVFTGLFEMADAQTSKHRRQMSKIASILGGLHHVRGACYPPEREEWRISFYQMLEYQNPEPRFRNQLVASFQNAYNEHRNSYPNCDHRAARRASKLAQDGERVSKNLMFNYR